MRGLPSGLYAVAINPSEDGRGLGIPTVYTLSVTERARAQLFEIRDSVVAQPFEIQLLPEMRLAPLEGAEAGQESGSEGSWIMNVMACARSAVLAHGRMLDRLQPASHRTADTARRAPAFAVQLARFCRRRGADIGAMIVRE